MYKTVGFLGRSIMCDAVGRSYKSNQDSQVSV